MIWRAPNSFAIWTASWPAFPVAPRTSTSWPAWKDTGWRSATQDDIPGFIAAGSVLSGSTTLRWVSMTVCSAIAPIAVSGRTK